MKILVLYIALISGSNVFASGGMIGGGEVSLKSLLACDAKNMDPTFSDIREVWVVQEVDVNGSMVPDSTLRVVTLGRNQKPLRYYMTNEKTFSYRRNKPFTLSLRNSDFNSAQIGIFRWNDAEKTGSISPTGRTSEVESIELSNCQR